MRTTKELAYLLCKQFRRHDDDASEAAIAAMLERFAAEQRHAEKRAALERFKAVRPFGVNFDAEERIKNAIMEFPGWLHGIGGGQ
jgi:hypothetical protein